MSDPLYQAALTLRRTRLWQKLKRRQVFSLRFQDKTEGYCSLLPDGLLVCPGQAGLDALRDLLEGTEPGPAAECLLCRYVEKEKLTPEELERGEKAAAALNQRLKGPAWPSFRLYRRGHTAGMIADKRDEKRMTEALTAASCAAGRLESASPEQLAFAADLEPGTVIPCLEPQRKGYRWELALLPPREPVSDPAPECADAYAAERLRKRRRTGVLQCAVALLPADCAAGPGMPLPAALVGLWTWRNQFFATDPVDGYAENAGMVLGDLVRWLDRSGLAPAAFATPDERTETLLRDLSRQTGIPIRREDLPELDEVTRALAAHVRKQRLRERAEPPTETEAALLALLRRAETWSLRQLPAEALPGIRSLAAAGKLDEALEDRLLRAGVLRPEEPAEEGT